MPHLGRVLVIGGSSSLAQPIIADFAGRGYEVIVTFNRTRPNLPAKCSSFNLDVTNPKDLNSLRSLSSGLTECYVFSGLLSSTEWGGQATSEVQRVVAVNLTGPMLVAQTVCHDAANLWRMGFISSRSALRPSFDVAYSAAKSGLTGLVRSLSVRIPPPGAVFGLAPTTVHDSNMFGTFPSHVRRRHLERGAVSREEFTDEFFAVRGASREQINGRILPVGFDPEAEQQ